MTSPKPLRLLPGVILAIVLVLVRWIVPLLFPDAEIAELPIGMLGLFGAILCALAIFVWWLFFSRAAWLERGAAIVTMALAIVATRLLADRSITGAGQGMLLYIGILPGLALGLVAWLVAARRFQLAAGARWAAMVAAIVLAAAPWVMMRTAGVGGGTIGQFHWRWTPTPEERLLAQGPDEPAPLPPAAPVEAPPEPIPAKPDEKPAAALPVTTAEKKAAPAPANSESESEIPAASLRKPEWPGFRGPNRDSVVSDVQIQTDWTKSPPVEMWRRPIGPGWSSFSVQGDLLYTQEQRGEDEIVSCYRVSTGEPVWRHRDPVRFYESNGGAGPRATPTLHNGRVYAFGATGILNALDARTGKAMWSRNVAADTGRKVPDWGFASSPLIVDRLVVVAAAGTFAAYDITTGDLRWRGPSYGGSYSSPQRATIDGVDQLLLLGGPGAISVAPADGAVLWKHAWSPGPIVQPAILDGGDILINAIASTGGMGTRRLHVTHGSGGWTVEERWTSNGLKPYFNDFVVHNGHAFGFDGNILSCIDLEDGQRKWKGGRYGNGQLLLLADQDLLLVLSEDGELILVQASTDKFMEVARVPALNAKTWNHPVLVGNILLIRNGEEMAAFRLSVEETTR